MCKIPSPKTLVKFVPDLDSETMTSLNKGLFKNFKGEIIPKAMQQKPLSGHQTKPSHQRQSHNCHIRFYVCFLILTPLEEYWYFVLVLEEKITSPVSRALKWNSHLNKVSVSRILVFIDIECPKPASVDKCQLFFTS